MPKDWLADATNEDRSSAPSSYESTADAAKSKLSTPVEIAEPASYRSPARFGKDVAVEVSSKGRTSEDSSGEDEGPEDAAPARRPVSMLSPPSVQSTPVSRHAPGRVQAPSWLVSDTDTSRLKGDAGAKLQAPTSAASSPRPTATSPTAEAPPSPRPEGQEERVAAAGTTAVARAPAWDEDDEEQRAMPFDKSEGTSRLIDATAAAKSTVSAAVGKLIDFGGNSRHTSAEYPSTNLPTTTIDHGISPYSPSVAKFGNLSISDNSSQAAAVTEKARASPGPLRQSEDNGSSRTDQSAIEVNGNSDAKSKSSVDATRSAARNADPDPSSASSEDFIKRFPAMDVETAEREIHARASPLPAQRSDSRPISEVVPKASAQATETRGEKSPLTGSKALASRTPEPRIIKPQARPAPKVTPGFVRERQKSLTGGSQRPASVDLAPPLPHTRGPRLPGFAGRQEDEQRLLAPAPASKAPVKTGPLKPWEREAVEREAADRSSVVRNQAGASSGASSPASHLGEPGQSDAAPEAYSGVSKLVSQWQQNASRGAPGWGRVGAHADPRRANEAKLFHDAARHIAARDVDGATPSEVTSHERGAVTGGIARSATVAEGIVGNASRRAGRDV
ncbi:related to ark1-actin regulating kinase [Ceraceosorus bombacis]|uniref:Related to ark1-actin regulating kinase n=1 Tax=Ceraceosorus bombacis TaxID=401625 RepID=A0A0P1BMH4_9BASI|nr:related to ark1-actin regulating kinase [Ceraceosorus bombacis]